MTKNETPGEILFGWLNRPHGMAETQMFADWERCQRALPDKYTAPIKTAIAELRKAKRIERIDEPTQDQQPDNLPGPRWVLSNLPEEPREEKPIPRTLF